MMARNEVIDLADIDGRIGALAARVSDLESTLSCEAFQRGAWQERIQRQINNLAEGRRLVWNIEFDTRGFWWTVSYDEFDELGNILPQNPDDLKGGPFAELKNCVHDLNRKINSVRCHEVTMGSFTGQVKL